MKCKGISLIVLVITIIVMIIIAGAIILTLSSSGIINRAKEAVEKSNLKSIQDATTLACAEYKLNGERGNLSEYIKNWLFTNKHASKKDIGKYIFDETGKVLSRNGLKEVTLTGTSISQDKTYNDSVYLRIYGKSEQIQTTQGKNLFDIHAMHQTTLNEWVVPAMFLKLKLLPNTQYILSSNVPQTSKANLYFNGSNTGPNGVWNGKPVIQTTDENGYIYIAIPNSPYREYTTQLLNGTYWIQLEKGEIATSYEYFIPNSPSPNYPNEIKSVSNFDLITSSKNLFNDDLMLNTNNYEYISPYHYYEISGLKPNTNYTLGLKNEFDLNSITKPSVGNRAIRINNTKINPGVNVVNVTSAGAVSTPRTIKSNTDGTLYLVVYQPQILDSLVNGLQLEEGDSQTTYEPFKGKKVNFPYTLRSLPDGTKDYIEIDNIKKTAKLYRNVGEKIFDGTENWIKFLTDNKYYVSNDLIGALYQNETYCLSTHYLGKTSGGGNSYSSGDIWLQSTSQYPRIYIADDNYSTVNSFKGFLAEQYNIGTPVKAQYQLEKSIIEHLDYNEVKTFYPYTQIYTNSTVQPTLEAKMVISN